ncbi:MAG: MCE family protein [Bacteroidetes bacterium]|nr:MCE family protein [Bacteroidota bacterium]
MNNKELKIRNLKVGMTVFIGMIILFIFLFLVGSERNTFTSTYRLNIFLSNIQGLTSGSLVSLGGMKIGSVDSFEFSKRENVNGIVATLKIPEKYKNMITIKSYAILKTIGLLGDMTVDISMGQKGEKLLEENDFLKVKPTLSFESFANKMNPVLDDIASTMKNLNAITDKIANGEGSLGRFLNNTTAMNNFENVLSNLESITNAIVNKKGTIGKLAYDSSLYDNISLLANNMHEITDSLKNGKGTFGKLLSSDILYNKVSSISNRFDILLSKTEKSDSTMVGGLFNDTKMYRQFNSLIYDLNALIKDLKENPENYVQFSIF